jgi:hypothetical protein
VKRVERIRIQCDLNAKNFRFSKRISNLYGNEDALPYIFLLLETQIYLFVSPNQQYAKQMGNTTFLRRRTFAESWECELEVGN